MALIEWSVYSAANPSKIKQLPHAGLWAKGTGADVNWYAIEIDAATGALPVAVVSGSSSGGAITGGGIYKALAVNDATATLVAVGASTLTARVSLTIYNGSAVSHFWGYSNTVTAANGTPIIAGTGVSFSIADSQDVWIIGAVGSGTTEARISEAT